MPLRSSPRRKGSSEPKGITEIIEVTEQKNRESSSLLGTIKYRLGVTRSCYVLLVLEGGGQVFSIRDMYTYLSTYLLRNNTFTSGGENQSTYLLSHLYLSLYMYIQVSSSIPSHHTHSHSHSHSHSVDYGSGLVRYSI